MTSSVSGKRSPAELIALGGRNRRWRRESNPCARLCRPLPHHSATPPLGIDANSHLRADDGIRTRDPHLGKVMRYQLRYIRAQRARSSPGAKHDDSPVNRPTQIPWSERVEYGGRSSPGLGRSAHTTVVLVFDVVRLSAPVPWLSGRASASHAEGRWFDPSRDHPPRTPAPRPSSPCTDPVVVGCVRRDFSCREGAGACPTHRAEERGPIAGIPTAGHNFIPDRDTRSWRGNAHPPTA